MRSEKQLTDYLTELTMVMDEHGDTMEQIELTILATEIETLEYCLDQ